MSVPLSDTHLTERAEILSALSAAGAFCGECGFEPGETGCADCVRVRELYADAVMPIVDRLRAENAGLDDLRLRAIDKNDRLHAQVVAVARLLPDDPAEDINASWVSPRHIRAALNTPTA